jgi:hypothetical protein
MRTVIVVALLAFGAFTSAKIVSPSMYGDAASTDFDRFLLAIAALENGDTLAFERAYIVDFGSTPDNAIWSNENNSITIAKDSLTITGPGSLTLKDPSTGKSLLRVKSNNLRVHDVTIVGTWAWGANASPGRALEIFDSNQIVVQNAVIAGGQAALTLTNVNGFTISGVTIKDSSASGIDFRRCSRNGKVSAVKFITLGSSAFGITGDMDDDYATKPTCNARNVKFSNINVNGNAQGGKNTWATGGVDVAGFVSVSFKGLVVSKTQGSAVHFTHGLNTGVAFSNCQFTENCATLTSDYNHFHRQGVISYFAGTSSAAKKVTKGIKFDNVKIAKTGSGAAVIAYFSSAWDARKITGVSKISYKKVTITGNYHIRYANPKNQFSLKGISYSCWKKGKKVLTALKTNLKSTQKAKKC